MSKIGTRLIRAREPIGDPKLLNAPTPVNPRYANVQSRLVGQTGAHAGNVKEKKDYSHESFRRVTRTELIDTLAYILKKQTGELESNVAQEIAAVAAKAVATPEYLPPSGRRNSESKSSVVSNTTARPGSRSGTPSRLRPASNASTGAAGETTTASSLLSTIVPMAGAFQRSLPKNCELYLIDVRDESAYAVNHIFGAVNYPVIQLRRGIITPDLYAFKQGDSRTVVIYANHESVDQSAIEAAELLIGKYFENVYVLTGGIDGVAERFPDWILGDLPLPRGTSGLGTTAGKATPVVYGTGSGLGVRPGTHSRSGSGVGRRTPVPGLTDTIGREMARAQAVATAIGPPTQEAFQSIQAGIYPYAKTPQGRDVVIRPVFQVARHSATPTITRDDAPIPYGTLTPVPVYTSAPVNLNQGAQSSPTSSLHGRATPTSYYTVPGQNQSGHQASYASAPQHQPLSTHQDVHGHAPTPSHRNRDKHLGSAGLQTPEEFDPERDTYVSVYASTIRRSAEVLAAKSTGAQTPVQPQDQYVRATPAVARSEKNASQWSLSQMGDTPVRSSQFTYHQPLQPLPQSHEQPPQHQPAEVHYHSHPQNQSHAHSQSSQYHQDQEQAKFSTPPQPYYNENSQLSAEAQVQLLEQQIRELQMQLNQPAQQSNHDYAFQPSHNPVKPVLRGRERR